MPIIALPDGHNAEFPDDMSMDQIKTIIQKKFPPHNIQNSKNNTDDQNSLGIMDKLSEKAGPVGRSVASFGAGAAQGLANIIPGGLNLALKGINALNNSRMSPAARKEIGMPEEGTESPQVPMFDFAPHNLSASAGDFASFFTPGGIISGLGKLPGLSHAANAVMKIPMIAQGLSHSANIMKSSPFLSKVSGNALLGGAYSPDHPLTGMAIGAAAPIIGKGLGVGKNIIQVNPKKLASTVQSAHDSLEKSAIKMFDKVGEQAVERGVSKIPLDKDIVQEVSKYLPNTRKSISLIEKLKDGDYKSLREMQSELFHRGNKSAKSILPSERNSGEEMLDLRDRINESISNHFNNTGNKDLSEILDKAKEKYRNLKEIYYSHPTVSKLVDKNIRKVPKNIGSSLSEDSKKMERLRKEVPGVSDQIDLLKQKENAMKYLKNTAYVGAGLTGLGYAGSLANKLRSVIGGNE